ncbi:hypothetical protein SAMN05443529_11360 [Desulfosporosinus hippei DSM 8344]|uniref:Uncharacterized protein n=2 Tax=Desulfosporosinus TaxID=79206 RepID=A0A1G8CC39_9FIRM|nr:hypothetical protein SAMN05443529_11360 [Desulfosporosinus hippei DSM 8344]
MTHTLVKGENLHTSEFIKKLPDGYDYIDLMNNHAIKGTVGGINGFICIIRRKLLKYRKISNICMYYKGIFR